MVWGAVAPLQSIGGVFGETIILAWILENVSLFEGVSKWDVSLSISTCLRHASLTEALNQHWHNSRGVVLLEQAIPH